MIVQGMSRKMSKFSYMFQITYFLCFQMFYLTLPIKQDLLYQIIILCSEVAAQLALNKRE